MLPICPFAHMDWLVSLELGFYRTYWLFDQWTLACCGDICTHTSIPWICQSVGDRLSITPPPKRVHKPLSVAIDIGIPLWKLYLMHFGILQGSLGHLVNFLSSWHIFYISHRFFQHWLSTIVTTSRGFSVLDFTPSTTIFLVVEGKLSSLSCSHFIALHPLFL